MPEKDNNGYQKSHVSEKAIAKGQQQDILDAERKEAAAKRNVNFLQIEKRTMRDLQRLAMESPKAMQLLFTLGEKMNKMNAVMASRKVLCDITKMSPASLSRATDKLVSERWIQVVKVGTSNAYIINNKVFWQSWGSKKYTTFRAEIIASEEEQDYQAIDWENVELRHFPVLSKDEQVTISHEQLDPPDQEEMDV